MPSAYQMKRNDRRPHYRVQLTQDGNPVDLTLAIGVMFYMKSGTTIKVNAPAAIINASTGIVEYAWTGTDTDTSGDYNIEFEVNWGGGDLQTFPSVGYFTLTISDDLV